MSDLISRKTLNEALIKLFQEIDDMYIAGRVIGLVQIQPTAYDPDKVVRWLENEKEDDSHSLTYEHDVFIHGYNSGLNEAIEIVKKGGQE